MGGPTPCPRLPERGGCPWAWPMRWRSYGGSKAGAGDDHETIETYWDHSWDYFVETTREEAPGEMKRLPLYDFHRSSPTFLGWYTESLSQMILLLCWFLLPNTRGPLEVLVGLFTGFSDFLGSNSSHSRVLFTWLLIVIRRIWKKKTHTINLHAIQSQNISKFTGNISKNTSKFTSKTNYIR